MSYELEFSKEFERIFSKLQRKNQNQCEIIVKKLREIKENPTRYKPLSNKLKGYWRVHIDSSFVVIYKIIGNTIIVCDYDHHDHIYEKVKNKKGYL